MTPKPTQYPVVEKINILLFIAVMPAIWGLLWLGSHAALPWALLAAASFSLVNHLQI
jgi:hypothetical protein